MYLRKCGRKRVNVVGCALRLHVSKWWLRVLHPRQTQRWSVRVTGNYRNTFGWSGENALDVDFESYH